MEYNVKEFIRMLQEENTLHNLVSRRSFDQEVDKHIEDSLIMLKEINWDGKRVIDIGSGAGFPALILALECPETEFTLLEADLKKSSFLEKVKEQLALANVSVLRQRAEEVGHDPKYRESFDICTARAVANMNILLEYGLPLLKKGGSLMLWKGRNYQEEVKAAGSAFDILGGTVQQILSYNLLDERDRVIVICQKDQATPDKYPRRVGIPSKRPL
ncbi:MAG: 16S rRNA (guanine(527)-N(7))-methyltransferase RsmG [Syntrophomonadaceae bacterium]|nr:16S rRNA (guanine(527)-N(7))-methyltransferase RsmG [Syntrophomonadaceae bacterium]MDD3024565.1 16S rRNA (guanine(527)-N(7))-methyltransferase RsmG [Syntrophomonadaceae bacterium]